MTAVKASPELKGIEPGVIETALRNINFPEMTNSATNRVDASIAPLVVAAKMDSGNTQKSVQGVLENNPQTREIATQLSKAIVGTLNQDAGAGQNRTTFNTAVKASPELKGIEPGVIETALRNINFPEMTNSATNRVDASIAPIVVAIKTDRQSAQENIRTVLESNPDKLISKSAGEIASVMAHVVDNSPFVTTNKDTFIKEVQNEMRYRGMSEDVIKTATTSWNMNNMINAALTSVEVKTASLPARINMDQENSKAGIVGAIGTMPDLNHLPQKDISEIAQAMQKIAKTSPGSFINLNAMQQALVKEGVSIENASKLTQPQNIRTISDAVPGKVDYSTAVMPALISASKEGSWSMADQLRQVPGIDQKAARELSNALVRIATTSPGSFTSRDQLKVALEGEGISPNVATIATQDGLRRIIQAVSQPANSISALEQNPGGIDINPAFLKLLVKRDGKGIPIPTAKVPVKDTDIYGFEPVISKVDQVDNLPAFIGIEEGSGTAATVRSFQ